MIDHGSKSNAVAKETTVAAVVVTYNRKQLLQRCLDAILAQARPVERIIIVDNCSTDGTPDFLRRQGFMDKSVIEYHRLNENGGSAGGYHEGMKRAYDQGYDWLWVMDDDGMPLPDTLARLLGCPARILFRGCVVLNSEDPAGGELAFGLVNGRGWLRRVQELGSRGGAEGVLYDSVNPFNGLLVSREVVRRIGLPKKELFIWGDEAEYFLRAEAAGVSIGTVLEAKFLHPRDRMLSRKLLPSSLGFALPFSNDPFRFYLIVRNSAYIRFRYHGMLSARFLKLLAYPLMFPTRASLAVRALRDGVAGRFLTAEQMHALVARG